MEESNTAQADETTCKKSNGEERNRPDGGELEVETVVMDWIKKAILKCGWLRLSVPGVCRECNSQTFGGA